MKILVNGDWLEVHSQSLTAALNELGYRQMTSIATALNGDFVPHTQRLRVILKEGDRLEVVAPMQGG